VNSELAAGPVPAEEADDQLARLDRIGRLEQPLMALLPYVMLVISVLLTIAAPPSPSALPVALILSATTAAWIFWIYTLHPSWRQRSGIMSVFVVVLLTLTGVLVSIDGAFGFFSFTGYFFAYFVARGRWRAAVVIVVAILTGTAQNGGLPDVGVNHGPPLVWALIVLVNVGVGGTFFLFGSVSDRQNARRQELLAELSEANQKLEASLRENAGLQAQLVAQAREAGVADERQRMAREIHDTVAQGLTGIITQLQAAERAEQAGPDSERQRHLAAAAELARDSLTEARRAVHELRPEALQPGGLEDALRHEAGRWGRLHQVPVSVTSTGIPRELDPPSEIVLLRVAQEALANVARHAHATRVVLTLSYMSDQVSLDIRDDGIGFNPQARRDGHFGLTGMQERLQGICGALEIESEPGGGTAISASVPTASPAEIAAAGTLR